MTSRVRLKLEMLQAVCDVPSVVLVDVAFKLALECKSRWAGFNLSIEMVSSFPPLSIVKTFEPE